MQVRVFLEGVRKILSSKGKSTKDVGTDDSNVAKLFEEVKAMVRELPQRADGRLRNPAFSRLQERRYHLRRYQLYPIMFEEFLFHPALNDSRHAGWLLLISAARDDFPWLYELGMDIHRAIKVGDPAQLSEAKHNLRVAVKFAFQSSALRELYRLEGKDVSRIAKRLMPMVDHFLDTVPPKTRSRAGKVTQGEGTKSDG